MNTSTFVYTDRTAIRELLNEVVTAFNNADLEKLLSLHTDDIIFMEAGMPIIRGKTAVRKWFTELQAKDIEMELDFAIRELEVSGNLAFVRGEVIKLAGRNGIKCEPERGKFICLLKKQRDGSWLRSHVIVNSDLFA